MLLCEYLFLSDYSVRQFERLAELVGLHRRGDKERERLIKWAKIQPYVTQGAFNSSFKTLVPREICCCSAQAVKKTQLNLLNTNT